MLAKLPSPLNTSYVTFHNSQLLFTTEYTEDTEIAMNIVFFESPLESTLRFSVLSVYSVVNPVFQLGSPSGGV